MTALPAGSAHAEAAQKAVDFFSSEEAVDAVLLVGSWARGWADDSSDLDLAVLVAPEASESRRRDLEKTWEESPERAAVGTALRPLVRYADIDVDLTDGEFEPMPRGWTSGPDDFELELGNYVAHSVPLFERGDRLRALRARWLPFYGDDLRAERLESARTYCLNNLDHVPWALERGDPLHAFHRLYHGLQEFVQALFIARRAYPVAYDKWITRQLGESLGLSELARELEAIIGVSRLRAGALRSSAAELARLLDGYAAS